MTVTMDKGKKKLKRKHENSTSVETKKPTDSVAQPAQPAKKAKLVTESQKSLAKVKQTKGTEVVASAVAGAQTGQVKKAKKRQKKKKKVGAGTTVTENGESVTPAVTGDSKEVPKKKKKKFSKFKKVEDKAATTVRLPVEPEAISCNWKNLLKTIESEKKPPKQNPSIFFRYKHIFTLVTFINYVTQVGVTTCLVV